jgi:hypothetical protein
MSCSKYEKSKKRESKRSGGVVRELVLDFAVREFVTPATTLHATGTTPLDRCLSL